MTKEELREKISKTFFSYETQYGKYCVDTTMDLIDNYLKEQLGLTDVGSNEVKCCSCDYPIVRNDGNSDYCGNCGDDLE